MAEFVIAAAGSALGGALIPAGFLGISGASLGYFAGSLLASAIFKPPGQQGPRLGDLRVSGTEYGQVFPLVYGSPRIAGQVLWASDLRELENAQSVGKGGGQEYTTFTYEVDLIIGLAENITAGVGRIWSNGELVRGTTTKDGVWTGITTYTGDALQLPDPTYESVAGIGQATAHRGMTTIAIRGLQLGNSGQIPNLTFQIGSFNRTDGVGIYAPLNNVTEYQDLVPVPQQLVNTSMVVNPAADFGEDGVRLAAGASNIGYYQGKFSTGAGVLDGLDTWISFEYAFDGTTGSGPAVRSNFFQLSRLASFSIELNATANVDSGMWTLTFFTQASVVSNVVTPLPLSGRIDLRFPVDRPADIELYVDLELRGALVLSSASAQTYDQVYLIPNVVQTGNLKAGPVTISEFYFAVGEQPGVVDETPELLYLVIEKLMLRAGYDYDEFDISDLVNIEQRVRGMAVAQASTTRGILEVLQAAFFFDVFEEGERIVMRRRQTEVAAALTYEELAADEGGDGGDAFVLDTGNEIEIPAQVAVRYNNTLNDYNIGVEYSDRGISTQESVQIVDLPMGLTPQEAKQIADVICFDRIASLATASLKVPLKRAKLRPGDIITCPDKNGRVYRLKIMSKRDRFLVQDLECVIDVEGVLNQTAPTDNNYLSVTEPRRVANALWQTIDAPSLRDEDVGAPVFYVAVGNDRNAGDQWPGAVFVRATVPNNFEQEFTTGQVAVIGVAGAALGTFTGGSGRFDYSNRLTVFVRGELPSTTRAELLANRTINAMLVGREVIRFVESELIGVVDGVSEYRTGMLLRGQLGTEHEIGGHSASEPVALLNSAVRVVSDQLALLGQTVQVKAVTLNARLSDTLAQDFVNTGVSMRPLSPANLRGQSGPAGVQFTWQRRTRRQPRYGGSLPSSAPLGEVTEAYRVEIFSGATLKRTVTASTQSHLYTPAEIAADGFGSGAAYTARVAQLSDAIGPGIYSTFEGLTP